jgi:hypothetical protein
VGKRKGPLAEGIHGLQEAAPIQQATMDMSNTPHEPTGFHEAPMHPMAQAPRAIPPRPTNLEEWLAENPFTGYEVLSEPARRAVQAYGLPANAEDDRKLREVIYHLLAAQASQATARPNPNTRTSQDLNPQALRKSQELLQKNHPYNGSQKTEAAHDWLMQCENFFADEVKMGFVEQTDAQKIVSASGALVNNAKKVWENHVRSSQAQHIEAIST